MCFSVCNKNVYLLVTSFYLANTLPLEQLSRIKLIWAYWEYFSKIITLVHSYLDWFVNTLLFIQPGC